MNAVVSLDDKYLAREGRVYLTGIQALVRLPLEQRRRDRAAGLDTSGFITGYRGSPLGGYDQALWRARGLLEANDVRFEPGLNEDLAATALVGTQQVRLFGKATRDGVFGLWYGKNPGLDRSGDAMRHANLIGTDPNGGVLVVVGDDHAAKSSDTCNQCEPSLMALRIPVLAPSDIQEVLTYGLFGWALSRYSGLWVGLKVLPHHMDCAASITLDAGRPYVVPDFAPPPGRLGIQWPDDRFRQEERIVEARLPAAAAFARANRIDRLWATPKDDFGIVAAGKVYQDVLQALDYLGLTGARRAALGIRLYKPGLVWPLEPQGVRDFARGLRDIVVIEEKEPVLEGQLRDVLYNEPADRRPRIVGKRTLEGATLFPVLTELDPVQIARKLAGELLRHGADEALSARLADLEARIAGQVPRSSQAARIPYFCAGCPHSRSLRTPEGARAIAGIGCHWMAVWTPEMKTEPALHMGGEGANWIGQAPYTETEHIFQNLGDGTYYHSGSLAIRAAVVAGVNITYKLLYNDAIAMTGGQPVEGHPTVEQIAAQLAAEGVRRIEVVSENPERFDGGPLAGSRVRVSARSELLRIEEELRRQPGVTALIYDQTCAAEKRRRRKRGTAPTPNRRLFINSEVCEGCGDCGVQSNCVAVEPLETELGRKRAINQSVCNKDFACAEGFCPSFVSVEPGADAPSGRRATPPAPKDLPEPALLNLDETRGLVITGIGGTGVVTVGALLGMAAHLEGRGASVLDAIGLAQKNGAVVSYVKIAERPDQVGPARIALGEADVLIACDLVVGSEAEAMSRLRRGRSRAVVNSHMTPTAQFVFDPDLKFDATGLQRRIATALEPGDADFFDAQALAEGLFGDAMAANLLMLGYAYQKGLLPVSAGALRRAVELNGAAVAMNTAAFDWGRATALDLAAAKAAAGLVAPAAPASTAEVIRGRAARLTQYQDQAYAARYEALVARVAAADQGCREDRSQRLTRAAAEGLYKLMAYKDEYEVARLLTLGSFRQELGQSFGPRARVSYLMAPPLLARVDKTTGHPRKVRFGPWLRPALLLLARLKPLRGTALDPFGRTAERRMERALLADYERVLGELVERLTPANYDLACEIAEAPLGIRGFGHVKAANMTRVQSERDAKLARLRGDGAAQTARQQRVTAR